MPAIPQEPGIYCITLTAGSRAGHRYVGQAQQLRKRTSNHLACAKRGAHKNPIIQAYYDKHGWAVKVDVLELCPLEKLTEREEYWCVTLEPELNILAPAPSSQIRCEALERRRQRLIEHWHDPERRAVQSSKMAGKPKSEEHRKNVSKALKGRKLDPQHRANVVAALRDPVRRAAHGAKLRGRVQSSEEKAKRVAAMRASEKVASSRRAPEFREKIAASRRGKKASPEQREKMRLSRLGIPWTPAHRAAREISDARRREERAKAHAGGTRQAEPTAAISVGTPEGSTA